MRVLIIGGTRFVGYHLTWQLVREGHQVVLFNRGRQAAVLPEGVERLLGDRDQPEQVRQLLADQQFDAVFDTSGRKREQTALFAELLRGKVQHFGYISSAGVYALAEEWPLTEASPIDPKSRHIGKWETDDYLLSDPQLRATSIRPVYIYGPQNYNDIEAWFFDRLVRDQPILIPGDGQTLTQLGHALDLARACTAILGKERAVGQVYNVSGSHFVSFTGLALACAEACQKSAQLLYFDSASLGRKFFPLRQQHFFSSIAKAERDLAWSPDFSLVAGLTDSWQWYQASGRANSAADFSQDQAIRSAMGGRHGG
ncbi:NAD-dependent epimerase/dehydratase family protein [Candidatus Cyanaurora vandensis]|uniref:NAD-dependent epimerase/dehydratase family protein n=1 Tax=Candidatus Cyanaurora vandensis TaxID=2714958 RepID=UPI00257E9FF5|nr:NAD-dependent epimerase/dehydratase family protein [Candidatus Cyanaurora vandensis]